MATTAGRGIFGTIADVRESETREQMRHAREEQRHALEIYVAGACAGCGEGRRMAAAIRARALPNVDVRLIDLAAPGVVRHAAVFAVPTYLLDGRIISLGNPDEGWLVERMTACAGELAIEGAG